MLKLLTSWFAGQKQACQTSAQFLSKRPMASLLTIITLAITLSLPTLFYVIADNLQKISHRWQANGQMTVYLKPGTSDMDIQSTQKTIQALDNVAQSRLVTAEEGMTLLQAQPGMADILHDLPENPLPAAIIITPSKHAYQTLLLNQLKAQLKLLPHVDQVTMDQAWINQLHHLSQLITGSTELIFILLSMAVVLIVVNTLRLDIQNRIEEIQVLKLIGATDAFIQRPFLYTGFYYGLIAGILAMITINICLSIIASLVNQLAASYQIQYALYSLTTFEAITLLTLSGSLGWLGAKIAVRSQLKDIEPSELMQV